MFASISRAICIAFTLLSANVVSAAQPLGGPTRLVRAMQLGEGVLIGVKLSIQKGIKEGKASIKQLDCINAVNPFIFTNIYVKAIKISMSTHEIQTATLFYEDAIGKKYTMHGIAKLYESAGVEKQPEMPVFTEDEREKLIDFSKTTAGQKLFFERITQSQAINSELNPTILKVIDGCPRF